MDKSPWSQPQTFVSDYIVGLAMGIVIKAIGACDYYTVYLFAVQLGTHMLVKSLLQHIFDTVNYRPG